MSDWIVVLVVFLAALVGSVLWNAFFFLETVSDKKDSVETGEHKTIDISTVDRVRGTFDAREAEEARYRNEYQFIDPSL